MRHGKHKISNHYETNDQMTIENVNSTLSSTHKYRLKKQWLWSSKTHSFSSQKKIQQEVSLAATTPARRLTNSLFRPASLTNSTARLPLARKPLSARGTLLRPAPRLHQTYDAFMQMSCGAAGPLRAAAALCRRGERPNSSIGSSTRQCGQQLR